MEIDKKNIAIGCDHAGYELKNKIKKDLINKGYSVKDFGTDGPESVDYPDYVHPLASAIENGDHDLGIVICGSGNGVNLTVNKHQGIRSALCWDVELAEMARLHNDANVLALSSRYVDEDVSMKCVDIFLNTEFEGGRHQNRVNKVACS
ncbi:ribose 5-phosphate isomerase B [bacterium SCSIO 12643]|nr:ribose 5-phosphate isomerase B [bacterium SCSIO 12643]